MKAFIITVGQICKDQFLDDDDKTDNPKGDYVIEAENEKEALDAFHFNVPIACLDDFMIEIEETQIGLPWRIIR